MIERPQFKAQFYIEIVKGEGVFVLSEVGHSVLNGRLFELVAPLINGSRSADDIAKELTAQVSAADVYYALRLLEQKGYLCASVKTLPVHEAAFWAAQNISPEAAASRLAGTEVSITTFGDIPVEPFLDLLKLVHVPVDENGKLGVVLAADYLCSGLATYNQEALRKGRPWILINPVGCTILIGPIFYPGQSGCWNCLAQRVRMNRPVEMFVHRKQNRDEPFPVPHIATAATQQIAYGMAATKIAKWIARGEASDAEAAILSLDVISWRTQLHPFTRLPQCAVCGDPASTALALTREVVLESRKKAFVGDGGHRAMTPEETLHKYEHHVSPITGAVNTLQRHVVPSNDTMHIYFAGENHAAPHYDLKHVQWSLRSRSSGKGITDIQAKASALCEALERYSGVFQGTESRLRSSFRRLNGLGIQPNDCMRFSERQYQRRDSINAEGSPFNYVPLPLDEEVEIEWSPVWSLTHKAFRYLPTEFCYYGYPSPENKRYCVGCSNGNAAGNTLEEAILQGFLELAERDAVALWWYNRVKRPAVDLDSFDEPYVAKLKAFMKGRHRELWVLDLTSDLSIPTFVAISRRTNHPQEHIMLGFGAHLDARIAVLRAMTELTQSLTWALHVNTENVENTDFIQDVALLSWLKTSTIANQAYLVPDESAFPCVASAYPMNWSDDLREDVLFCQELVERRGMEMLVLDQTRPDIGLSAVKVVVPGLRHFWARFAPGRLYDIPVALGWVPELIAEEQLNPTSMFI